MLEGGRLQSLFVLGALLLFAGGSSPSPGCGGGGPGTTGRTTSVDQHCDTRVNGQFPPGCGQNPGMSSSDCGNGPGQCPCGLSGNPNTNYCGICSSNPPSSECIYCPSGYQCPANPCDQRCPQVQTVKSCPASAPISCGGSSCCPMDYPVCCANGSSCGQTQDACDNADSNNNNNNQSGCGVSGGCAAAGLMSDRLRSGCCSTSGCLATCTDDCDDWYEVNGRVYGPCPITDQACLQNAANGAVQAANNCQ